MQKQQEQFRLRQSHDKSFMSEKQNKRRKIFAKNSILKANQQEAIEQIVENSAITSYIGVLSGKEIKKQPLNNLLNFISRSFADISLKQIQEKFEDLESIQQTLSDILMGNISQINQDKFVFSCMSCYNGEIYQPIHCHIVNGHSLQIKFQTSEKNYFINFDTVEVNVYKSFFKDQQEIILIIKQFELTLTHSDQKIVDKWFLMLKKIINKSLGVQFKLSFDNKILSNRYETQRYFLNNCQTGDIILFQDNHFFAKAQRFFTNSQYDHVGLIIRDPVYDILIFQSNSHSGVSLTMWNHVIKYQWYRSIPKITWRKLSVPQKEPLLFFLHQFILNNLKKKYHISLFKLMATESIMQGNVQPTLSGQNSRKSSNENNKIQGYFCSELVATAYKQMKLITRNKEAFNYKPACRFIPYDFTQKAGLVLENGSLSPQFQIIFDDDLLAQDYFLKM